MSLNADVNPDYNRIVAGLLDVLIVQERFVLLANALKYVPIKEEMHVKYREKFRKDWERLRAQVTALEMVSKRIIWQILPHIQKNADAPFESLVGFRLPDIPSLKKFQHMDAIEAIWTTLGNTRKYLKLVIPFVMGDLERSLLKNEIFSLLQFEKFYLAYFRNLKGREPLLVDCVADEKVEELESKIVHQELIPLLLNLIRTIEQNSQDAFFKYFFMGEFDFNYESPMIDAKKLAKAKAELYLSQERDYNFISHFMKLIACSPKEPLFQLRNIKLDRKLRQIHKIPREYAKKPLILAFQRLITHRARGHQKKMVWKAILGASVVQIHAESPWVKMQYARIYKEESVLEDFIAMTAQFSVAQ